MAHRVDESLFKKTKEGSYGSDIVHVLRTHTLLANVWFVKMETKTKDGNCTAKDEN